MASLQSSCMVLATNPKPLKASSSGTARRFHVSCSSGGGGGGGVDRRNMLLGLGGLYGAAAANLKARADPIKLENIRPCGVPSKDKPIDDKYCCPPESDGIHPYVLPDVKSLRVRPAAHKLRPDHLAKYEEAVQRMRELDETDPRSFMQQANVHCAYCEGFYDQAGYEHIPITIHHSWLFFPWHRWYLYFHERILGSLIKDPTFALPFWNWDHPDGMYLPKIFDKPNSPLYDAKRNPEHRETAVVDLSYAPPEQYSPQELVKRNLAIMYKAMLKTGEVEDFMGQAYLAGGKSPKCQGTLEHGPHNSVHDWVGDPRMNKKEDMGNFYTSGRDPVFYSHHSNVDRMWTIWKSLDTPIQKDINNPDYLNASFLFYDENKELVRVRVGDALDNQKMGYEYEKVDIPWESSRPIKRSPRLRTGAISVGAQRGVFPLTLDKTARVLVSKPKPGKAVEKLVLEDVYIRSGGYIRFDVYINSDEDEPKDPTKPEYVGTYSMLPHKDPVRLVEKCKINFYLEELYDDIDIDDNEKKVLVIIVPRANGPDVTIGGIKILEASNLPTTT